MIYYIDGYNFLFFHELDGEPFEVARGEVLDFFAEKVKSEKVIVVFDAHKSDGQPSRTYYKNIEVLYSAEHQTADEYLLEAVRFAKVPQEITVVSNDKALTKKIKLLDGHGQSFESFIKKLGKNKVKKPEKPNPKTFGVSLSEYLKKFDP